MTLGEKLKQLRTLNNRTVKEVAIDLKITVAIISLWENDKVIPSQKNILKLADYYKVKITELTKLIERR